MRITIKVLAFTIATLAIGITAFACGSSGAGGLPFTKAKGSGNPPPLEYQLDAPSSVGAGETAPIGLRVINGSNDNLDIQTAKPPHEVIVRDAAEQLVWSSLITTSCPNTARDSSECSYLTGFRISVGARWNFEGHEAKTLTAEWPTANIEGDPVAPGEYFATILVSVSNDDCTGCKLETAPVKITVTL